MTYTVSSGTLNPTQLQLGYIATKRKVSFAVQLRSFRAIARWQDLECCCQRGIVVERWWHFIAVYEDILCPLQTCDDWNLFVHFVIIRLFVITSLCNSWALLELRRLLRRQTGRVCVWSSARWGAAPQVLISVAAAADEERRTSDRARIQQCMINDTESEYVI